MERGFCLQRLDMAAITRKLFEVLSDSQGHTAVHLIADACVA